MSQIQKIHPTPDTVSPHASELYSYAVRIELSDSSNEPILLGSGILFYQNKTFKVLTARHCLVKGSNDLYPIENIIFSFADRELSTFNAIKYLLINKDEDYAIVEVNYDPHQYKVENYKDSLIFIGSPFGHNTSTYGYSKTYLSGRKFDVQYVAPDTYSINAPILSSGRDLEIIRGFSGAGIYTKIDNKIFCEGFIKSKFESSDRLEEIVVGKIPNLGDCWIENYNTDMCGNPYMSSGNNTAKVEYTDAWRSLLNKVGNGKTCSDELTIVLEKKREYPLAKSDSIQKHLIWTLFRKKTDWSEDERKAFLLALRDLGQWPSLYGRLPDVAGNLHKHPDCLPLLHRSATLLSDDSLEPVALDLHKDTDIYESIMRKLFLFDFKSALEQCKKWAPVDMTFAAKKLMLLHLWSIKDNNIADVLEKRITKMTDGIEVAFIETAIANQCDFQMPFKYSYEPFNKAGLDSPGEVLSSILNEIDSKKDKIKLYGTHTINILSTDDNTSFSSALRVINYLIESGIPPSDGFIWTIDKGKWLKVFRHLFINFPYPMVFYTLLYRDETLARRIGQEMSYTDEKDFRSKLPDILIALIKSLISDSTPNIIISSIFLICGELFCSLDSYIWFYDFLNVVKNYLDNGNLKSLSHRDEFYKFMEKGIAGIRTDKERCELFIMMSHYIDGNILLISQLLSQIVCFEKDFTLNATFEATVTSLLNNNSYKQMLPLIAQLSNSNLLTQIQRQKINNIIKAEGLDYAKGDKTALHFLSFIVQDIIAMDEWKRYFLELNIWECGITDDMNSYYSVNNITIEHISSNIIWSHADEEIIIGNLEKNLTLIEKAEDEFRIHNFMSSSITTLLSRMYNYLSKCDIENNHNTTILKNRLENQMNKWSDSESLLERLTSQEFDTISNATREVLTLTSNRGIYEYKEEIGILINRILTKNEIALSIIIGAISSLTSKWPDEMNKYFGNQLLILLKVFCEYDYESLDLCVPSVNHSLISMAKSLHEFYQDSSAINYWLSEEIQNRFCY